MNNLNGMRTYLVGPMDRVVDGGKTWRSQITPLLKALGVDVINPCEKPIKHAKEDDNTRMIVDHYKKTGQFDRIKKEFGHIRNADLRCVDVSDFIIAKIDMSIHMCGSYEEIVTANRQKKPILVWCEQGKNNAPNWLFFMLPHQHVFGSIYKVMEYLYHIDKEEHVHLLDRWIFFTKA